MAATSATRVRIRIQVSCNKLCTSAAAAEPEAKCMLKPSITLPRKLSGPWPDRGWKSLCNNVLGGGTPKIRNGGHSTGTLLMLANICGRSNASNIALAAQFPWSSDLRMSIAARRTTACVTFTLHDGKQWAGKAFNPNDKACTLANKMVPSAW